MSVLVSVVNLKKCGEDQSYKARELGLLQGARYYTS